MVFWPGNYVDAFAHRYNSPSAWDLLWKNEFFLHMVDLCSKIARWPFEFGATLLEKYHDRVAIHNGLDMSLVAHPS